MSATAQSVPSEMRAAMLKTNQLFNTEVFQNRNFGALDEIYTSSAHILPPGSPMISGREAIKTFWSNFIESVNATSAVLESIEVMPTGNGAVEIGKATLAIHPPSQDPAQIEVKYVVYWQQDGGSWKWNVDIWNTNS